MRPPVWLSSRGWMVRLPDGRRLVFPTRGQAESRARDYAKNGR